MKQAFEAVWDHGTVVPIESVQINDDTRLLVVILDEPPSKMTSLAGEARRQSLLVSKCEKAEDELWEANIDDSEWRE